MPMRSEASRRKVMIIGTAVGLSVILFIVLMVVFLPKHRIKIVIDEDEDRIECPGFTDAKSCRNAGCEYENDEAGPACFMKKDSFGYKMGEVKEDDSGMTVKLESRVGNTPYGSSIPSVTFQVSYITQDIVRVKLIDGNNKRYEVPVQFPLLGKDTKKIDPSSMAYEVNLSNNTDLFSFQIKRKSDQTVLWDTSIGGLMMSDKFLQISSYLPSKNIYGLGENVHTSLRHNMEYKTWPMFARDRFPEAGPNNLYGVHPFYMCLEKSSDTHGVLLLNSNAMEVSLLPAPGITFRTIGGIIDLFFIVGKEPENTVKLYTSLIGKPMMPPYWSLGFQLSRYGYNSLDTVKKVVERTRKAGIPQDVQFLDIDHMEGNRDFTFKQKEFAGLPEYMRQTREEYGLKWIIILDPAIEAVKSYGTFETGIQKDVFIKRSHLWKDDMFPPEVKEYKNTTFGRVWPASYVAFPNFFDNNAKQWWTDSIVEHHKLLPFEGLWIDMNEPASFGTNEDRPFYCPATGDCWSLKCPGSPYEDPPYNPLKTSGSERLSKMTLCMESVHTDGKTNYRHYDVHSLYGWSQSQPTFEAAEKAIGARSLVISRSTYPSSGRHAGHWLGDNRSTWNDLKYSIIGMLEFNMFGIPYIGADICGFNGDVTAELCMRWMQLGAFYPFFRNHNGMNQKEQDPVALGDSVVAASKRAVERRYALNPYLYTLFYRAHVDGSTVIRPLFHEFPTDKNTLNIAEQFMWGKCLLISPVLSEGAKSVNMYLPNTEWWHFKNRESHLEKVSGNYLNEAEIDDTPVHVRGGCIIPTEDYKMANSNKVQPKNITLYVFPLKDVASGEIYVDDLTSINPIETKKYARYSIDYKNCTINFKKVEPEGSPRFDWFVTYVHVFKANEVKKLEIPGQSLLQFGMNYVTHVLTITANMPLDYLTYIKWYDDNKKCSMLP